MCTNVKQIICSR